MQKMSYFCDCCEKVIGNRKHISLNLGGNSAIMVPPGGDRKRWEPAMQMQGRFVHFINAAHMAKYFERLMLGLTKK